MSDVSSTGRDSHADDFRITNPAASLEGLLPAASGRRPAENEVAQRAGDFIGHLREQLAELDRREQNVNAQCSALDQERRRLRFSSQQAQEQLRQREEGLDLREQEFAAKLAEWESSTLDMRDQRETLQRETVELAAARARLETEAAAKLEVEREVIAQEQAALDRRIAEYESKWQLAIREIDATIDKERASRTQVMERELAALEAEILEKRQWWDDEQSRCQDRFEEERLASENQLAALSLELVDLRQGRLADLEDREHDLARREVDVEKRTRFHESHLEKLRRSLEQQRHEIDQHKQSTQVRQMEIDERLRQQAAQLRRFRDLLEHREESLDRERDLLAKARRTVEKMRSEELAKASSERLAWEQECESHRADMRRQQDLLSLHAENLEGRRSRLDRLRDELEESHRETLEMRLAIEQSWAQLSQTFGEETSRQRIEQARAALNGHFEQVRRTIDEQRVSLDDVQQRLSDQSEEHRIERQEFSDWITGREEQLRQREAALQEEMQSTDSRESQWCSTRERWLQEKIEAESVIRQLLSELDAGLATACPYDPLGTPRHASVQERVLENRHLQPEDESPSAAA